jgi:two-component system C4-dicarboxylate transport response regulator DctD
MPERAPVLFVDDEASMRESVSQWLGLAGFDLITRDNAKSAVLHLTRDFRGPLVTDLRMEGMDGLALLRQAQEIDPELPVVVITGHGDVETAVEAMRLGAYDFVEKPFSPERFLEIIRHASEKRQLVMENRRLRRTANEQTLASRILGNSRAMETLRASVAELA